MLKFEDRAAPVGMRPTADGYLVGEVRCARVGIQQYLASEIGMTGDGMVNVYRPEETVFDRKSLSTFSGKPVTLLHPPVAVDADNWREYAVGDVGEDIARDGEYVRVPIKLMDADVIRAVQNGTREISMGYTCGIEIGDGVTPDGIAYHAKQTGPLRINHLAIVPKARGGAELRVGDSAEKWGAAPVADHQPGFAPITKKGDIMSDTFKTVVLGDKAAQVAIGSVADVEQFKTDAAKRLADAETKHKAEIEAKDEEIGTLKADLKKAQDAALKPEDMSKLIADRVALESIVKAVDESIVTDGKSDAELRKAAVAKALGDDMVKDAEESEIKGMFKAVAKDAAASGQLTAAITNVKPVQDQSKAAQSSYVDRMTGRKSA